MKWISVEDKTRLENHEWYLVTNGAVICLGSWDCNGFVGIYPFEIKPTHWMPLPELPNEVD